MQSSDLNNINPQLAKEQIHYTSLIEIKRAEIKRIEREDPQLYEEFSSEIKKMDSSYQKLKNELPVSPNQEETVKAMIQNLQIQTELLNQQLQIIQQINQIKNNEKDGTQNI
jgi:Tfp pilus assembly protein PilN